MIQMFVAVVFVVVDVDYVYDMFNWVESVEEYRDLCELCISIVLLRDTRLRWQK
jgi:hypothetical protein